ncbi:MAG: hypothetical protein ACRC8T_02430 [Acidaminococcaceae bacterium]
MTSAEIEEQFQAYMKIFKSDADLGKAMSLVSFENLFNPDFLKNNSKFTSMDDMIWRSGFGIMNLLEVENVNQEKWNAYIASHTDCSTWYEFGKLAMVAWMKSKLEESKEKNN